MLDIYSPKRRDPMDAIVNYIYDVVLYHDALPPHLWERKFPEYSNSEYNDSELSFAGKWVFWNRFDGVSSIEKFDTVELAKANYMELSASGIWFDDGK